MVKQNFNTIAYLSKGMIQIWFERIIIIPKWLHFIFLFIVNFYVYNCLFFIGDPLNVSFDASFVKMKHVFIFFLVNFLLEMKPICLETASPDPYQIHLHLSRDPYVNFIMTSGAFDIMVGAKQWQTSIVLLLITSAFYNINFLEQISSGRSTF